MSQQPEYFLLRGFGKLLAAELTALGWTIHSLDEQFSDPAEISDRSWLELGFRNGWHALARDARMLATPDGREPLLHSEGVLFHLDDQELRITIAAARLHAARRRIDNAAVRGGPAAYAVGPDQVHFRRTWRGPEAEITS